MREQTEDIRARLEAISEELADLALQQLRDAVDAGGEHGRVQPTQQERRLNRARRAVEKAITVLSDEEPSGAESGD